MILNHRIIPQTKTVKYVLRTTSTFQTYLETTHTQKDRTNQTQMKKDVLALNYHPKINYHCIKRLQSLFELILGSTFQYCNQKLYYTYTYFIIVIPVIVIYPITKLGSLQSIIIQKVVNASRYVQNDGIPKDLSMIPAPQEIKRLCNSYNTRLDHRSNTTAKGLYSSDQPRRPRKKLC